MVRLDGEDDYLMRSRSWLQCTHSVAKQCTGYGYAAAIVQNSINISELKSLFFVITFKKAPSDGKMMTAVWAYRAHFSRNISVAYR
jgi:hypothetical protein